MQANPLHQVNAQANMTNGMNQTGAVGVLAQYGDQSGRQLVSLRRRVRFSSCPIHQYLLSNTFLHIIHGIWR